MTAFADAAGKTNRFGYNSRNNLVAVTNTVGEVTRFTYNNLGQRTSRTEPNGEINQWEYDSAGRLRFTVHPDGSRAETQYDTAGRIGAILDRAGGRTSFQYNVLDQVVSLNDPLNRTTTFGYDAVGNMTSQTDAASRTTRFLYDSLNRQNGLVLPDGTVEGRAFNTRGGLASKTNSLGHITQFDYDDDGRITSATDPLGSTTRYGYDSRGQLTGVTNALGHATIYVYDANGRLTQTVRADGAVEQVDYDSRGLTVSRTDVLGHQTFYGYDGAGRLTSVTNALGNVTRYGRDSLGRIISQTDANGFTTTFDYDTAGNRIRTTYADGTSESSLYDSAGRRVADTNANGHVTFYGYDLAGQLISVTNALNEVTRFVYDSIGQRIQSIDALGRTNRFEHDTLGRLTGVIFPDETAISHVYDAAGQIIASIDEAGVTNFFGYDAANRLTSVTNALGHVTTYAYDAIGQLVFETNANGHVTSYNYDSVNRRIRRTLPGGQFETFAYDLAGNLTNRTDFNGLACTYEYDALDRPLRKTPDPLFGELPVIWTYDAVGLRTNMSDASGASAYRYNSRYRLLEKRRTWAGSGTSASLHYAYDAAGNVTNVFSTATNGTALAYTYDPLDRLATVIDPLNGTITYAYDPVGNLATLSRPNGFRTTFSYDPRDHPTNVTTWDGALAAVSQYLYQYNLSGHRVTAAETVVGNGVPSTITRAYGYDAAYRLTTENLQINSQLATLNYSYDAVGNRLTRTSTLASLPNQSFTYDASDQLASDTYDANGNTLTSPAAGITTPDRYDHSNRLITRGGAQPITFQYDGDGNRVARTVAGVTTHFQTDEVNPTGWPQVLEEHTWIPGDPLFGVPAVTRTYTYGRTPLSQDQIVGAAWSASHFGHDGHGNVRYLSGADGAVTNTFDYDAFGNLIGRSGNTPVTRLFAGEEFDSDTGLYNLRARYHNPATGRFWTRDSFPGVLARPSSRHGYAYVENNPVNYIDPSGHYALAESMAVSYLSVPVRQMVSSLWDSVNHYTHGLGGGEALKAVNSSEAFFIQGLSQHVGINLGRQNFFTTMQGAPFLLAHNPFVFYAPNDCFRYQVLSFVPNAPIYGGANKHPVFTFDYSNDPMFQFAEKLADVGNGSLLGAGLREWATEQAMLGTQGGDGLGLWANFGYNVRSDVANMLAGAISPQSWVDGMQHLQDRASERAAQQLLAGESGLVAQYYGWASLGGDLLGLNGVLEGTYNVDLATGAELGTEERWRRGPVGISQMAGVLTPGAATLKLRPLQTAKSLQALNGLQQAVTAKQTALTAGRVLPVEVIPNNAGLVAPKQCLQLPAPKQPTALLPEYADTSRKWLTTRPSSGVDLVGTPGKTTTILGRYFTDMEKVVWEIGNIKNMDFGPKPGDFNVLNVPYKATKGVDFWTAFNQPFLDAAIARGDDFLLATEPLPGVLTVAGKQTGFGREIKYLESKGYVYNPVSRKMVKNP